MDISSLYTNIPQEEGTEIVYKAYDSFRNHNPPVPTRFLREMLGLILNENSFQFNGENYLKTHGTAMGTKMAISFANIFMAKGGFPLSRNFYVRRDVDFNWLYVRKLK